MNKKSKIYSLCLLGVAAFLGGCNSAGFEKPSAEVVQDLRSKNLFNPLHYFAESVVVTDLKCTAPHADQKAEIEAEYKMMGANAADFVKAYANCSYTLNAVIRGRTDRILYRMPDREVKDAKLENELFIKVLKNGEANWKRARGAQVVTTKMSAQQAAAK